MERVGRRKILPAISMLLGTLVIGFVIPGQRQMISPSMGSPVPGRSATRSQAEQSERQAVKPQLVSQVETTTPIRQEVTAGKRIDRNASGADRYRDILPGDGEPAAHADVPKTRQIVDEAHAPRTRVANRQPDSQPLTSLPKALETPQPVFVAQWPLAKALIAQLSDLKDDDTGGNLAKQCIQQLERLHKIESLDSPECVDVFEQLRWLKENAETLAENSIEPKSAAELHRLAYAIQRRLEIWEQIHLVANQRYQVSTTDGALSQDWKAILNRVENELRSIKEPEPWRKFLLLEELRQVFDGNDASAGDRRQLAQRLLRRMASPQLTVPQQEFLDRAEFSKLRSELEPWASEPVDYTSVMRQLEDYEFSPATVAGDRVVAAQRALLLSPNEEAKELARRLDIHYRNANLRIAVSGDLINQLLPQEEQMRETVRDRVLGANVRGESQLTNRLRVRLMPDRNRWQVGIESRGEGNSQTEAERGPVVFENHGRFRVDVRKMLLVDRRGVRAMRAEAEAESNHEVTGLSTDFDRVPLVNAIVRSIAMNQQASSARNAELEVNRRLEALASRRMDEEVQRRLEMAKQGFQREWVEPMRRLGLDPKPIEMQTTTDRLIVRYRLASGTQLAAFTPRPMALTDSWFSMQIHESTLNNVIRQLDLDGKSMELRELHRTIGEKLGRNQEVPEDLPEGVTIQFADHDAVRLVCDDGRIQVTLKVAKLAAGKTSWHNFMVQVNYIVEVNGLEVKAMRDPSADDYIAVQGVRRLGNRIAIATIFSKVFAQDRHFPLLPDKMVSDERLKELAVRQLVVDNGWIGISVVPEKVVYTVGENARNDPPGFLR